MREYKNRPIIEATDSPLIINEALHDSVSYWNKHMDPGQASAWRKKAADAWGAVEDGFSIVGDEVQDPEGDALLYVSADELELALVAYGCKLIDAEPPNADAQVVAIDGLLKQIDAIKSAQPAA
jgi:hypothetical protein